MAELKYSKFVEELYDARGIAIHPENIKPGGMPFLPGPLHMDKTQMPGMTHWIEVYPITEPCGTGLGTRQLKPGGELFEVTDPKAAGHAEDNIEATFPTGDAAQHYHPHEEMYLILGTNPDDKQDLGGELEIWLGAGEYAEKHIITKPSVILMPPGLVAHPMIFRRVDRLILKVVIYSNPEYYVMPTGLVPKGLQP
jgi:hypothetical protein